MKNLISLIIAAIVIWFYFDGCSTPVKKEETVITNDANTGRNKTNPPVQIKPLTDEEYAQRLNEAWNSKKLDKVDGFPQYSDYRNSLDSVIDLSELITKSGNFLKLRN